MLRQVKAVAEAVDRRLVSPKSSLPLKLDGVAHG